jgi:glutathione S-transferase
MYKLYGRPGSGSLAVQVALEELAVSFERIWVGREPQDVESFRAINPTGRVPALQLPDGKIMFESAAMLIHLAALSPQPAFAPRIGTSQHATFLQWMVFLSANVYESALHIYYPARYSARGESDAAAIRSQGLDDFCANLSLIGKNLAPYVLGSDYSFADPYLYMLASWYPEEKTALYSRAPELQAHANRLSQRPAVIKVEKDHAQ